MCWELCQGSFQAGWGFLRRRSCAQSGDWPCPSSSSSVAGVPLHPWCTPRAPLVHPCVCSTAQRTFSGDPGLRAVLELGLGFSGVQEVLSRKEILWVCRIPESMRSSRHRNSFS